VYVERGDQAFLTLHSLGSKDPAEFSAGDVASVYLNFNTGEGFCTLNGSKLDFGEFLTEMEALYYA
jgi:hypothetical protein